MIDERCPDVGMVGARRGMWDGGCGMGDVGCGIWYGGCGLWDVGREGACRTIWHLWYHHDDAAVANTSTWWSRAPGTCKRYSVRMGMMRGKMGHSRIQLQAVQESTMVRSNGNIEPPEPGAPSPNHVSVKRVVCVGSQVK